MSKHFLAEQLEKFIDIKDIPMTLMTPRIQRMKDETQALNDQGLRQTRLYVNMAASLAQTKGEPENIRRAKAFAYHLKHIEQPIYDAEQLIGSVTGMWPVDEARNQLTYEQLKQETQQMLDTYFANRGGFNHYDNTREGQMLFAYKKGGLSFEEQANLTKFRFGSLMARDHYDANIDFQVMQKLIAEMEQHYRDAGVEFENWEIGSRIEKHFVYNYGAETMQLLRENGWNAANHTNLNYKRLVVTGIGGILGRINGYLENAKSQKDKDFYTGCKIVMEAVSDYIFRYAKAAAVKAEATEEPVRRAELQKMAVVMEKISTQKPETFTEAIELVWMIQLIGNLFGGSALSLARFDQYMYPFYKHDIEAGTITVDRVFELICSLYMKLNEPKMRTVQSLAVGGICCESGEDACNDLSKLCLEAMSTLKTPYPNMSARVMPGKTPDWFYDEIMRTVKAGCGQPMVLNDAVWVPNLTSLGIPEKWARDYYNMGCTEIMIQGKDCNWTTGGLIFFPELLNAMIRKSAAEGRTYESFEEFLGEYLKLIDKQCDEAGESGKNVIHSQRERNCDPFASSLIDGCLENATDYFQGGTDTGDPISVSAQGLGTAADSLSAIRKFVFEENRYTLAELGQMLHEDFAGHELDRLRLANGAPKFGNDDDYVDEIAKRLFDSYAAGVRRQNEDRLPKTRYVDNVFSYNMHITLGESLGATANGRSAGEAISDCVGPTQGADTEGSTALLNSVLKLSHKDVTGAHALNFKISPSFVKDREGTQAAIRMLKVYLEQMGPQIQINYQNPKDLLDAQVHPDKHRDLVVRIAGYCEYFVNLDHRLQCEIIERTLHEVG